MTETEQREAEARKAWAEFEAKCLEAAEAGRKAIATQAMVVAGPAQLQRYQNALETFSRVHTAINLSVGP